MAIKSTNKAFLTSIVCMTLMCIMLQGCSDYTEELSGNYFFRDEGRDVKQILSHTPNRKDILSKVVAYGFNKDFIVVEQHPLAADYVNMLSFYLLDDTIKYPLSDLKRNDRSEKEADSILKQDAYYQKIFSHEVNYWIISNKENQVYGPYTKEEFLQKRNQLHVPDGLQLEPCV